MIMSRWVLGVMPAKKHMVTLHDYRKVPYLDWVCSYMGIYLLKFIIIHLKSIFIVYKLDFT